MDYSRYIREWSCPPSRKYPTIRSQLLLCSVVGPVTFGIFFASSYSLGETIKNTLDRCLFRKINNLQLFVGCEDIHEKESVKTWLRDNCAYTCEDELEKASEIWHVVMKAYNPTEWEAFVSADVPHQVHPSSEVTYYQDPPPGGGNDYALAIDKEVQKVRESLEKKKYWTVTSHFVNYGVITPLFLRFLVLHRAMYLLSAMKPGHDLKEENLLKIANWLKFGDGDIPSRPVYR